MGYNGLSCRVKEYIFAESPSFAGTIDGDSALHTAEHQSP